MDPTVWGPHGWFFLHSVTLAYPKNPTKEDKDNIKNFFNYAGNILPCYKCRDNYREHLEKYPLDDDALSSREKLVRWLINIHNDVNIHTGKPVMEYEDVIEYYIDAYKPKQNYEFYLLIFFIILILAVGAFFIIMKVRQ